MYPNMPYYGNQFNQGNYGFNPQVPGFRQRRTIERVHGKKGAEAYQHQLDAVKDNRMADMQNQINALQM